jgi:hypothetical protein
MKVRVITALVAMLVLAGAGCGSSESKDSNDSAGDTTAGDTTTTETSVSKPEFIAAADKVCSQLGRDTDGLIKRMGAVQASYPDAADETALDKRVRAVARLLRRFEERFRAGTEELASLRGPDDSTLTKYLEGREAYADTVARLAAAQAAFADATANDQAEANKAIVSADKAGDRTLARLQRLAREYGFKTCHRET